MPVQPAGNSESLIVSYFHQNHTVAALLPPRTLIGYVIFWPAEIWSRMIFKMDLKDFRRKISDPTAAQGYVLIIKKNATKARII